MTASTLIPVSNRADWSGTILVQEDGIAVDTSEATDLFVELEDPDTKRAMLTASLGRGVSAEDVTRGMYSFRFPADQTAQLDAKTYWFAGLIKTSSQTLQLFKVRVRVEDGIVG